jgi:hypothetical protein
MSSRAREKFDYSFEEWTAIENIVSKECRPGSLSDFERRRLRNAANSYRVNSGGMTAFLRLRRKKQDQAWATVDKLSAQLFEALHALNELHASPPRPVAKIIPALEQLRGYAASRVVVDMTSETAKQCFYRMVFEIWTEFGGTLGWSTNAAVGGPCVRYFNAVVRPVMGADSPKLSYIPELIDNEKCRREEPAFPMKKPSISRA